MTLYVEPAVGAGVKDLIFGYDVAPPDCGGEFLQ
jgi:hypothetical protein